MNPLYQQINNTTNNNLLKQFQQFKQQFSGNPQEQVQQLLNNGRVSQTQYNRAVQIAQQLQQFLK